MRKPILAAAIATVMLGCAPAPDLGKLSALGARAERGDAEAQYELALEYGWGTRVAAAQLARTPGSNGSTAPIARP